MDLKILILGIALFVMGFIVRGIVMNTHSVSAIATVIVSVLVVGGLIVTAHGLLKKSD